MASYRQYCPVARATELLGERWTVLVVRNLMLGATTYNNIARGVPHMSRSMLTKRLRELERSGLVATAPKANGQGSVYSLTEAGRDLHEVVEAMAGWAERWADVRPEHTDPGFALWIWCQAQLDRDALPEDRTVIAFVFPDEPPANRRFWLLVEDRDAEVCLTDPGGDPAAEVVAGSRAFVDWHRGERSWQDALRRGDIVVRGRRSVVRSLPSWNARP